MNITKAIADNVPTTMQELTEERDKLVARLTEINREMALLQTLQQVAEAHALDIPTD